MLYTCVFLSTVYIRFLDPYPSVSDQKNKQMKWTLFYIEIRELLR